MVSKSRKLFDQAKKVIPSGVNSPVRFFKPYPFFVKKSQGSSIWDEDGRRYIDYCNHEHSDERRCPIKPKVIWYS